MATYIYRCPVCRAEKEVSLPITDDLCDHTMYCSNAKHEERVKMMLAPTCGSFFFKQPNN